MLARQNNVSENSKRPSVTARMCLCSLSQLGIRLSAGEAGGGEGEAVGEVPSSWNCLAGLPPLPLTLGPGLVKSPVDRQTIISCA